MAASPRLVIHLGATGSAAGLAMARAQAYTAAAAMAGWEVLSAAPQPPGEIGPELSGADAAVLIGASADEAERWLRAGHGLILDGIWSTDPAEVRRVCELAAAHGQPLIHGDELLHAPVVAGALTEAAEIGPLTAIEARGIGPAEPTSPAVIPPSLGVSALARALLSLRVLAGDQIELDWEEPRLTVSPEPRLTWRGRALGAGGTPITRVTVIAATHRGQSVIHDLQLTSATGVVRAELMPAPHLETNGEPVILPAPTHQPAQLESFGMIALLDLLRRAVVQRTQPLTSPALLAEALAISGPASAGGVDPSR